MRAWLLLLMLVPMAQACDPIDAPTGPGLLVVESWDGEAQHSAVVEERDQGADCRIVVPVAVGDDWMAWGQGTTVHIRHLATGDVVERDIGRTITALAVDGDDIDAIVADGSGYEVLIVGETITSAGTLEQVPRLDGPIIIESVGTRIFRTHLGAQQPYQIFEPPAHPEHDATNLGPVASDDRWAVYEVRGQSTYVAWDDAERRWHDLPLDHALGDADVDDGIFVGTHAGNITFVDLSIMRVTERAGTEYQLLDISPGWFITGVHAVEGGPVEDEDPVEVPAAPVALLAVALLALARRH